MARYRTHPDCDNLVCFIYDPDGWVNNLKGVMAVLEGGTRRKKDQNLQDRQISFLMVFAITALISFDTKIYMALEVHPVDTRLQ